ncbi:MAG: glycerol acyltransferase [Flavobacteriaceae bacterium]|jgi:1-acyl-sn-glycerol-3-phosphate acyltransferase|nr:glycerol acyltransferase [Flavobacteriaceae bacterium]
MKKFLGKSILKLIGWKLDISIPIEKIPKSILVAAPHTSNWDFFYTIISFWALEVPMKFFIKDDWTKPWYGFIIKSMGGIGIDRSQRANRVDYATELMKNSKALYLLNTPEGSRSRAEKWKTGFYYMAKKAEVPILLAYCDYEKKIAGIGKIIHLEKKSKEEILTEIQEYYIHVKGKYPENYNPKIF